MSGGLTEDPAVGPSGGWGKGGDSASTLVARPPRANCSLNMLVVIAADASVPVSVAVSVNNPRVLLMRRFMANVMYIVQKLTAPSPPDVFAPHANSLLNPPVDDRVSPSAQPGATAGQALPSPSVAASAGPGPIVIVQV